MSEYTETSARTGLIGAALVIIVAVLVGLALAGWISDNVAEARQSQVAIERAQQAGKTERAEVFGLTLASITAMGTASGVSHLIVIGLLTAILIGEAAFIWRARGKHE